MKLRSNGKSLAPVEQQISELAEDVGVLKAAGGGAIVEIPEYVREEAARVAKNILMAKTPNSISFIAMSDSHQDTSANVIQGNRHAGQAAKIITDKVQFDFLAFLGDATAGTTTTTTETGYADFMAVNEYIGEAFKGVQNFRTVGNHDTLASSMALNDGSHLTANQLFAIFGAYNTDCVYPSDKSLGCCYKDFSEKKIRVLCLNTSDLSDTTLSADNTNSPEGMSAAQAQWFADSIDLSDKTTPEEWGMIILSHHPLDWGGVIVCGRIIKAYLAGSAYSETYNGTAISHDYTNKNLAMIIAQFHGHVHGFKVDYIHAGASDPTTVKRVAIPNMCFNRSNEYGENETTEYYGIEFGESTSYEKTSSSENDTAFCVITIDLDQQKIHAFAYGAGYDRVIDYSEDEEPDITNQLRSAVEFATPIGLSNEVKEGYYISTVDPYYGVDATTVITGLIPFPIRADAIPPTIYVKGMTSGLVASHDRIYAFYANKTGPASAGAATFTTITSLGDDYFKIEWVLYTDVRTELHHQKGDLDYIAFSLTGTIEEAQNLIITFDEPIE